MKAVSAALLIGIAGFAFIQSLAAATAATYQETVLYSFCQQQNCADGANSYAALIAVNGILYGTTSNGGAYNAGTIFSLDPTTDVETVLHSFAGGSDGALPLAALIDVNGKLYGTTSEGGTQNSSCYTGGCGTVFSLDLTTGKEKVLYAFCQQQNCADGQTPQANLIHVNRILYGTTQYGGVNGSSRRRGDLGCTGSNCGIVFSLDPKTGAETVLHSFAGGGDGAWPVAGLINVKGILYGTTAGDLISSGGTVFSIDPSTGVESVLHSFTCCGGADGAVPLAALVNVHGALYGTTFYGGGTGCYGDGCGTVFSITTSGAENVVHAFQGGSDGAHPEAGLVNVNGTPYGTSYGSGNSSIGTIFKIRRTTSKDKVVYSFQGPPDGAFPRSALVNVNGTLYGTTIDGGIGSDCGTGFGCGTVFALTKQ